MTGRSDRTTAKHEAPKDPAAQREQDATRTRSGTEATPSSGKTIEDHTTEHESGYGGKGSDPRVSVDQRE